MNSLKMPTMEEKRDFVYGQMKINIVLSMNNFHLPTPSFNFYCGGLKRKKLSFSEAFYSLVSMKKVPLSRMEWNNLI